jgi:hypothetical protein
VETCRAIPPATSASRDFRHTYLIPCAFALALVFDLAGLPNAAVIALNQGTWGTFTVQTRDCSGRHCSWSGSFSSDDGTVTLGHAHTSGDAVTIPGQTIRAQAYKNSSEIYRSHDTMWIRTAFLLGSSLCYWPYFIWTRRRRPVSS